MTFDRTFEHQEALMEAALKEFTAVGYDQASINTILKEAGMSKGQFYYHFGNKEGLYLALIEVLIARKTEFLATVMQPEDFQQDIFTILKTQIQYGLAFTSAYPEISYFSESFLKEKGNPIYNRALAVNNFEENSGLNALIERAYMQGEFREELSLAFVQKIIGYHFTHVAEMTDLSDVNNAEENLNLLIDFLKKGLARNHKYESNALK